MKIVEHYPSFHWGLRIEVEHRGDSLLVSAYRPYWETASANHSSWDLVAQYRNAPRDWANGRTGKNAPHIKLANADTDEDLIAFVKQFGPIVARSVREEFDESPLDLEREPNPPRIIAEQGLGELRNESILYRNALMLLAELDKGKKAEIALIRAYVSKVAETSLCWPRQWQREAHLREAKSDPEPNWRFDEAAVRVIETFKFYAFREPPSDPLRAALSVADPLRAGHGILCELVNAFQPWVYRWGNVTTEGPHLDLRYGIRPLLYHILREEYLNRGGIAVCANGQCRDLFNIERAGQRFCSETCSQHQRQREYWAKRGRKLRKKRLNQQRTANRAAGKGR